MSDVKLTKTELKVQSDSLKRYKRYLPTLVLKQQQLQLVINNLRAQQRDVMTKRRKVIEELERWVAVFVDPFAFQEYIHIENIVFEEENIAGVDIENFIDLEISVKPYDILTAPFWLERGIAALEESIKLNITISALEESIRKLQYELQVTIQRVNLFDQILIPRAKENIRKIRIFLGDQQTASVVRGKIAKRKLVEV